MAVYLLGAVADIVVEIRYSASVVGAADIGFAQKPAIGVVAIRYRRTVCFGDAGATTGEVVGVGKRSQQLPDRTLVVPDGDDSGTLLALDLRLSAVLEASLVLRATLRYDDGAISNQQSTFIQKSFEIIMIGKPNLQQDVTNCDGNSKSIWSCDISIRTINRTDNPPS